MTKLFLFILVFFFIYPVAAQLPGYRYFKLEKENRQIKINTLYKNRQGYLLVGTNDGLYKFDGEKYARIPFTNEEYSDTVTAIFQDRQGKMWIGFRNGRIANMTNKRLVYFNPEEGTPRKKITAFLQDKEDRIWFSSSGEGVYCIQKERIYLFNTDDGLSDNNVSCLEMAVNGDILAGTDQGINICRFSNGIKKVTVLGTRQGLPDYIITSIKYANDNQYWIGMQDKGFCVLDLSSQAISIPAAAINWKYGQINDMLYTQNNLWIATQDNGLLKFKSAAGQVQQVPVTLTGNSIKGLVNDNQGNNWLVSNIDGLVRSPGESLSLLPIPSAPAFEHVHAILSDHEGNTWINNQSNEIIRITQQDGISTEKIMRLPGVTDKTDVTALYQDFYGNIWVGTMGKGIFIIDPKTFTYRAFKENSLFNEAGIFFIHGNDQTIYCSSLQGSMVIELAPANRDIHNDYHYTNYDNINTGTNYIYTIFKDSHHRIWFATDGMGLTMLENGRFSYFNKKEQIKDDRIYSITEDLKGTIWFSTASAGIYSFNGKTFTNYSVKDGLSDLNISVLKADRSGNIIIVHKRGLDVLDPETGNIYYLTASQGITSINAEDIGSVTTDTSGNIMVSTVAGILTYTHPENSLQKPTALIESVQLFLKDLDDHAPAVFRHDENNFTFNFTGLYYTDPEKVYYKYKLEGLDSSWVITKDRSKNFPKLEPGKYTFRIQAALNKNFIHADEASYTFIIKKAFYKTLWFRIGTVLLLLGLVYAYIRIRVREVKRIEKLQQEKIRFQFEVLRNQVNPHFLFNSFNTLISTIEEEPGIAVEYAEQLSAFFRNIVTQRDNDLITLREEIQTLDSYSFLQKKRYGENLRLIIEVSEEQKDEYKLPPLTLQLLMENAIKHNALSNETPLLIRIYINEANDLCITNNINPKINPQDGAGMGLQNIVNRYNLLTNKTVSILRDERHFSVTIPLLK